MLNMCASLFNILKTGVVHSWIVCDVSCDLMKLAFEGHLKFNNKHELNYKSEHCQV